MVYLDEDGDIIVVGERKDSNLGKTVYYRVPPDEIKIQQQMCYATFAGPNELVVLLNENKNNDYN